MVRKENTISKWGEVVPFLKNALLWIVIALVGIAFPSPGFARADATSAEIGDLQLSVAWDQNWEMNLEASATTPSGDELLVLGNSKGATLMIVAFATSTDVSSQREALLAAQAQSGDGYELLDSGGYGVISYSLAILDVSGAGVGAFSLFRDEGPGGEKSALIFTAPVSRFQAAMTNAQMSISFNGEPVFNGIDASGLAETLVGTSTDGAIAPTSVPRAQGGTEAWVDPVWGYTVTWEGKWTVTNGPDGTSLGLTNGTSAVVGFMAFEGDGSPGVLIYDILKPAFESSLPAGSRTLGAIVGGEKIVMAAETPDGIFIQDVFFLNNNRTIVVATVLIVGANPESTIADYRNSVTIAGQSPLAMWEEIYP